MIHLAVQIQTLLNTILLILYIVTVVGLVLVVITENRNPLKAISWVIVLLFIPGIGLLFYFFFGQDNRQQRIISRRAYKRMKKRFQQGQIKENDSPVPERYRSLISLMENNNHSHLLYGTSIHVYTNGVDKFNALLEEIKKAVHHIHLQYYIFCDDTIGTEIKNALIAKAKEGVEVRILYDGVGSWKAKRRFFNEMKEAGIEIYAFLRVALPVLTNKVNYRNHRKIVVIDGKVGFMGGMNIADRYTIGTELGIWRDTHFRFEGRGVYGLQASFLIDWYGVTKKLIDTKGYYPPTKIFNDNMMQIVTSGPIGPWRTLLQATIFAITNAKEYVYIQTPYFLPTEGLNQALQTVALGGLDVRLMLPLKSDARMVNMASHSYIDEMEKAGVKVFFYKSGFLHSKLIVIDDNLTVIGSANMDFRSFEHNFEINAFVYQKDFAIEMKEVFLQDEADSELLIPSVWLKRPLTQRFVESFMRLFSPLF